MISLRLFLLLSLVLSAGCVKAGREAQPRYFWPPYVQDAKIEYLGFYASEANLREDLFTTLSEVVLGVDPAKPLFSRPFAIDARGGRVLVTDSGLRKVFLLDLMRKKLTETIVTSGEGRTIGFPAGCVLLDGDEFLIVDSISRVVSRFSHDGRLLASFGEGRLTRPTAVAFDRRHQRIVVVDTPAHKLVFFALDGSFLGTLGERGDGPGEFNFPVDADFDVEGNLFVLDSMNFRVQRFDWNGSGYGYVRHFGETGTAQGAFVRPKGVAVTPAGHVYVTDGLAHKVVIFDRDGNFLMTFGQKFVAAEGRFAVGGLYMPAGIAADEKDGIWVVDSLNRMVHHFQYLNEEYLRTHPILPGETVPEWMEKE